MTVKRIQGIVHHQGVLVQIMGRIRIVPHFGFIDNIVIHLGLVKIIPVKPEIAGGVPWRGEVRVSPEDIILHDDFFRSIAGGVVALHNTEAVPLSCDGGINDGDFISFSKGEGQCAPPGTAVVHVPGERFPVKIAAVALH